MLKSLKPAIIRPPFLPEELLLLNICKAKSTEELSLIKSMIIFLALLAFDPLVFTLPIEPELSKIISTLGR